MFGAITGGLFFNIIAETVTFGTRVDPATGRTAMETIMPGQLNRQYIFEGMLAGSLFLLCAAGFLAVDWVRGPLTAPSAALAIAVAVLLPAQASKQRSLSSKLRLPLMRGGIVLAGGGAVCLLLLLNIKVPGYLRW